MDKPPGVLSVLFFDNSIQWGGVEEHILSLVRGLDKHSFRLYMVCNPELMNRFVANVGSDLEVIPLVFDQITSVTAGLRFASILKTRKIDILHSHMFQASLVASPVGMICRVPVIIETPHLREEWRRGWFKSRFVVDRLVGRCVDQYIAVSAANARYLVERKGLPNHKVTIIRSACDVSAFDPQHPVPYDLKRQLGFAESDPILLVVGRLELQKGHRVLLNALPAIKREFPNVRLVCLSEGSLRAELQCHAEALGLSSSVRFVGRQKNLADWLALADITVLPSFYEGLPLVPIESLAAGRPVIATAVDGTPEVVINGKTGLTVPPGNAELLAEAVCRLLHEPPLRRKMAEEGRRLVVKNFSVERLLSDTEALYYSLWRQKGSRLAMPANPNQSTLARHSRAILP